MKSMLEHRTIETLVALVAEDEPVIRAFATAVLQRQGLVVLSAGDAAEALDLSENQYNQIDFLLVDKQMGGGGPSGIALAKQILRHRPDLPVLVIGEPSDSPRTRARAGFASIPRPFTHSMLTKGVMEVLAVVPSNQFETVSNARSGSDMNSPEPPVKITRREQEVLSLLAQGYSTKDVANRLGIAVKTASCHRNNIMTKLGAHEITKLVRYAIKHGLIQA
jgi:NarL family two-component system response regulator YdfI